MRSDEISSENNHLNLNNYSTEFKFAGGNKIFAGATHEYLWKQNQSPFGFIGLIHFHHVILFM